MVLKMFAVFDAKAAFFGIPFSDQSESSAIRNFGDAVRDGSNRNNMWHNHPEDFSLFQIGEFDQDSGEILPCIPKSIITASAIQSIVSTDDMPLFKNSKDKKEELVQ